MTLKKTVNKAVLLKRSVYSYHKCLFVEGREMKVFKMGKDMKLMIFIF